MPQCQLVGERLGKRPDFLLHRAVHDRDVYVQPFRSRGLDQRRHLQRVEGFAHDQRRFEHPIEAGAGAGIEIEMQVVGPVDIVAARVPLVQVDAPEIDDPQ